MPWLFELTLKSTYYFVYILFTSCIFFVIFGSLIKPEKVATSKKQNEQLKSQIAKLSSQLNNLKEMLKKCRTSDLTCESTTGTSDHEMEWSLQFYSDSYDNLNSLQANTVRELKCLSDRLSKISTEVESIGKAVDDLQEHSYQFNLKTVGIRELHNKESAVESSELCLKLFNDIGAEVTWQDIDYAHSLKEDSDCWPSPDYTQVYSQPGKRVFCLKVRMPAKQIHHIWVFRGGSL